MADSQASRLPRPAREEADAGLSGRPERQGAEPDRPAAESSPARSRRACWFSSSRSGMAAATEPIPRQIEAEYEKARFQGASSAALGRIPARGPVYMLSGQGSQKPGMGQDLLDLPEVRRSFDCASDVLGFDLAGLVAQARPEELEDTRKAQAAICALSVGIARALEARGVEPAALLGFSLGEVSALAVSGMLSDEQTFSLVKVRSELMAQAGAERPGAMSALLKADEEGVSALCEHCSQGEVLVPANFNCPGQIVVAGTPGAVQRAEDAWAASGKRFSRLATSGAFHSPLMEPAAEGLAAYLESVEFAPPRVPLVCNVTASLMTADQARSLLVQHLLRPVLFQQSIEALLAAGAASFVEVGFGGVLSNLVKRIDKTAARACVQDKESFEAFVASQQGVLSPPCPKDPSDREEESA